ncbi:MAG: hypothetical protein ACRD59_00585 [Candidatus Acidiferrales bacterium]
MLTLFTTAKPFRGHIGIIQRNALKSWTLLHPGAEVILFGDDEGAREAALDLGLRHVPHVERNEHGTKFLASIFDQAQELARHERLCYANCDIVLTSDFAHALSAVANRFSQFLMVGQRWDTDIRNPIDFDEPEWQVRLRQQARFANHQRPPHWIDYFAFSRGLYLRNAPALVIGRPGWDNWLLWKARASGAAVVDASSAVLAVHQNHDYSYHPDGEAGVWQGEEAQSNYTLLEGGRCFRTIENATHRLTPSGFVRNHRHWIVLADRSVRKAAGKLWFGALAATRPIRHRFGLRRPPETPISPSR